MVKVGAGFVVALAIEVLGLRTVKNYLYRRMNWEPESCGCDSREAWLNKWQVYIPKFVFKRLIVFEKKRTMEKLYHESIKTPQEIVLEEKEIPDDMEPHEVLNFAMENGDRFLYVVSKADYIPALNMIGVSAKIRR